MEEEDIVQRIGLIMFDDGPGGDAQHGRLQHTHVYICSTSTWTRTRTVTMAGVAVTVVHFDA